MKFRLVEPLVCPICGAEFETEEMMKMHLITRHSEEELRKAVSVITHGSLKLLAGFKIM